MVGRVKKQEMKYKEPEDCPDFLVSPLQAYTRPVLHAFLRRNHRGRVPASMNKGVMIGMIQTHLRQLVDPVVANNNNEDAEDNNGEVMNN